MNDEIKATLEWLKECGNNDYLFETGNSKMLLDYITNLQQENERIKKMNMHEHKYGSDMEEKYLIEKTKNDRAIEYIKEMDTQLEVYGDYDILSDNKNDLLNILNGRSDE